MGILTPETVSAVASYMDKRIPAQFRFEEGLKAIEQLQRMQEGAEIWQKEASVKISTTNPVLLVFLSDLHIGNFKSHHSSILRAFQLIQSTPNVFVAFGGDEVDNAYIFRDGLMADIGTVDIQGGICMSGMKILDDAGKVIYYGMGNHNAFLEGWYQRFEGGFKAPIVGKNHGTVRLTVGEIEYIIFQFHKISMGNSTMSPLLREQRAIEYLCPTADIVVGSHTHRLVIGQYSIGIDSQNKLRTLIEAGSMKPEDDFQRNEGNLRQAMFQESGACVLLYPTEKKVEVFYSIEQGINALRRQIYMKQIIMAEVSHFTK